MIGKTNQEFAKFAEESKKKQNFLASMKGGKEEFMKGMAGGKDKKDKGKGPKDSARKYGKKDTLGTQR